MNPSASRFSFQKRFTRYNWLLKIVMRSIARKTGEVTIATQDYEYTDWKAVARFTEEFLTAQSTPLDFRNSIPVEMD